MFLRGRNNHALVAYMPQAKPYLGHLGNIICLIGRLSAVGMGNVDSSSNVNDVVYCKFEFDLEDF